MITLEPDLLALIQGKLRQIHDLNERLRRAPKQVELSRERERRYQAALEATGQHLSELRKKAQEKQMELSVREAQIEKFRKQLDTAANNREYALLNDQIKATAAANEVLSDEILELLELIDKVQAQQRQDQEVLEKSQAESAQNLAEAKDLVARLKRELAEVESELNEQQQKLPDSVRQEFVRKRPGLGEKAVVAVKKGACGGCWQTITSQMRSELVNRHVVYCRSCGALLYLAKDE